jgi:type IV pilus assembly protein PilO
MNLARYRDELRRFDCNELTDMAAIGYWPASVRALVLLLLLCICCGLAYVLLLRGTQSALRQAEEAAAILQSELHAKRALAASLADEQARMRDVDAAFAAHMQRLPARAALPALLDALVEAARQSGLALDALNLREEVAHEFYAELPLSFELRGGYHAFGAFANAVAALPQLVGLRNFNIERLPRTNELRMVLSASAYRTTQEHRDLSPAIAETSVPPATGTHFYQAAALRNPFAAAPALAPDVASAVLESFDLAQLTMSGTLERQGQRWALIRDANGSVTRVGLGALLGRDHGRIVRITRERIDLIEQVLDGTQWRERSNSLALPGTAAARDQEQGAR